MARHAHAAPGGAIIFLGNVVSVLVSTYLPFAQCKPRGARRPMRRLQHGNIHQSRCIVRRLRQGRLVEGRLTQDRVSLGLLHRAVAVVPGGPALLPVLDGPVIVLLFAGARGPDGVTVICGSQEFRICPLSLAKLGHWVLSKAGT